MFPLPIHFGTGNFKHGSCSEVKESGVDCRKPVEMEVEELSLDEIIKREKREKKDSHAPRERTQKRDRDEHMSDSRSFRGPRREGGSRRRRDRGGTDTPYSRGRYNTSGDASQSWKHDLFDKASDEGKEVEETGWGTRRSRHDEDLARGTPVVVSNLHWEVSEDDLKVIIPSPIQETVSPTLVLIGRSECI